MSGSSCDECRKIAIELREVWTEAWLSTDDEFRAAWTGLLGGTEEDLARAEEIFPRTKVANADRLRKAVMKKFKHETLTGHKIPLRRTAV